MTEQHPRTQSAGGIAFLGRLPLRAEGRVLGAGLLALVVAGALAYGATGGNVLPLRGPAPALSEATPEDPVLVAVGAVPIRLSDARAQAGPEGRDASPTALLREGYVEDAAEQLTLAMAAEADGLDQALEVRAALALARRRVLAEAYLDLAVQEAASDEKVRAAYDAEVAALDGEQRVAAAHILVSSEEEAADLRARIERGASFSELAQRQSLDMDTRGEGGSFGMVPLADLPGAVRDAAQSLPIGAVSDPIEGEGGWHLVRIDARNAVRIPPFEERAPEIAARLREQAMRRAAETARLKAQITRVAGDEVREARAGQ
ncbi:peptidylprolyl isomerase [Parvularcula dongshanensis]|uniref:Parvulin-like PPIase n=1 Tax=Parvularcula dongshanensis TaxID=1173995 RepID=A0A840I3N8_9PROT|nr:peptidyl-prolyl cis-trans isomerase [Parvularcula dongshanensis]MBB4658798.1 peptidyl-prolyl cis-trans isomerase C [Parvularcula dongshanensis]